MGILRDISDVKLVAFDLDDTLAPSKARVSVAMAEALHELMAIRQVLIISGAVFQQFENQVLTYLPPTERLENLHLMPTCGTRYFRWHSAGWIEEYAHDLPSQTKFRIVEAIEQESRRLGLWEVDGDVWGERIEDRGSQITYSALGQRAPLEAKRAWDASGAKKELLRAALEPLLPDLEVRGGGSTSIDITEKGIDKAYGVRRLGAQLSLEPDEIEFVGDRLSPGGNDFPVVALGVRTHAVSDCDETLAYIIEFLNRDRRNSN